MVAPRRDGLAFPSVDVAHIRVHRVRCQGFFEAETDEHAGAVREHLDACADFADFFGGFEDVDGVACLQEGQGSAETA